jgi:hypothetical protein
MGVFGRRLGQFMPSSLPMVASGMLWRMAIEA